ncbi:unnamed protein product, partial [Oikopleura dioica]
MAERTEAKSCSKTCDEGLKSRSRKCKSGNCKSNLLDETQQCTETVCPRWDEWEAWSICTASCGGGMHYRQRQCIGGGCQGIPMAYEPCNQDACDAGCSGPRDVLFVAHYTTYMGSTFADISAFFENIISTINVEPSDSSIRFAFSFFNHAYIEFFAFDWLNSIDEYKWAFSSFPPASGNANYIGRALKGAADTMTPEFGKGRRIDTVGTVVLLTNAASTDEVNEMADQLKEKVDRVIVVGLGYAFGQDELAGIASSPTKENLYIAEESSDLAGLVKTIADEICATELSN